MSGGDGGNRGDTDDNEALQIIRVSASVAREPMRTVRKLVDSYIQKNKTSNCNRQNKS